MDTLSFITDICGKLKTLKRTGWIMRQVPLPESDADHMHRCAMCALLVTQQPPDPRDDYSLPEMARFHPSKVNTTRLLRMAVTHDLCEALAGDITPFCNPTLVASRHDKEQQAMQAIQRVVGGTLGQELFDLWQEYEALETTEAIYTKDIDKFEMIVQAWEYEKAHLKARHDVAGNPDPQRNSTLPAMRQPGKDGPPPVFDEPLRTFFITTNSVMKTPLFRRLDGELRQRREAFLKERGWQVTDEERQQYTK